MWTDLQDQDGKFLYTQFYRNTRLAVTPWEALDTGIKEIWVATAIDYRKRLNEELQG